MNSETLKTFLVLSTIKNYTQTANKLFVAQSTVTNRILDLEKELGFSLFIRDHKKLTLTNEGIHFLEYAKRILDLEKAAITELTNLNSFSSTLKIGSTNTIYDCHLQDFLVNFQRNNSDISLNIVIDHSLPLIEMLQDNLIDIAFTYVPYTKNNIACSLFTRDNLLLVTSKNNKAYADGIIQKDLIKIPYFYCDFNFQNLGSFIKNLFPKNYSFPLTLDKSANLIPFIIKSNGYTFLPESMVRNLIDTKELTQIKTLDFSVPYISCYIEHNKNTMNLNNINKIINEFKKQST